MPEEYYCEKCGRLTPIKEEKCFDCGGNMLKTGDIGDDSEQNDGRYTDEEIGTPMDEDDDLIDMPDEDATEKKKSNPTNSTDDDF